MNTTEDKATKAPFRVSLMVRTPNPRYVRLSHNSRTRHPDIETRTHVFFETLDEARAYRAANGGCVYALTAGGKIYRTAGDGF